MAILSWVVVSIVGEVRAAPLTDEEKQAFKWYDALGLPRTEGSQWVHVATGHWSQRGNEPPENHYISAFLLKAEGDRFTVHHHRGNAHLSCRLAKSRSISGWI